MTDGRRFVLRFDQGSPTAWEALSLARAQRVERRDLRTRGRLLSVSARFFDAGTAPEVWHDLLMEAAGFAAAAPAVLGGRRCGFHAGGRFGGRVWPGIVHATLDVCQGCHAAGPKGFVEHAPGCWLRVDAGGDPALIALCRCGAVSSMPRWLSMSASIGCPRCGELLPERGAVGFASAADRWAEGVRRAAPPARAEIGALWSALTGLRQLAPEAGATAVSAHAAALTRARVEQLRRSAGAVAQALRGHAGVPRRSAVGW